MEEENIIIYNEDNNLETVDILESDNDITYDETIQVIEVDEPENYNVGVDGAFPALGAQNDSMNHAIMMNRDCPDQHTIGSITGLEEIIDDIYSLKTVESDKIGSATYYKWRDMNDVPSGADRFGRFVSLHTKDNKISICDRDNQIFGVTVDSAGFVGGQDDGGRNDEYCLVATSGVVRVRCRDTVVPSQSLRVPCYVMSDDVGLACVCTKENTYGFYVIDIDNIDGHDYAVISLDSNMNQIYAMSEVVADFRGDLNAMESRVTASINATSLNLKNSLEQDINVANQNAQDALNSSQSAVRQVGTLTSRVNSIDTKVDAVRDSVVLEYQELAQQAVDELTNGTINTMQAAIKQAQSDINEANETADLAYEEVSRVASEIQEIVNFTFTNEDGEELTGASGFIAKTEDNSTQMAAISRCLNNGFVIIDTWIGNINADTSVIYYTQDTKLYHYYDNGWKTTYQAGDAGLLETIASISQQISDGDAVITSLTSYSDRKYEIIEVWNGYEEVDNWEQAIVRANPNIIYYDTTTETYWQCNRYAEDVDPWSSVEIETGTLELKEIDTVYYAEDTKLYYYYDNGWKTSTVSVAPWVKSVAMTKQLTDANSARIDNIVNFEGEDGAALAALSQKTDANEASITALTSYVEDGYEELDEVWTESGKYTDIIYYSKENSNDETKQYWYYQNGDWRHSTNPADAGLPASLVSIKQSVSKNKSSIDTIASRQDDLEDEILKLSISSSGITSSVINISKYAVGKHSQTYGLTREEAMKLLRDGTVFVPSENVTETYSNIVELDEAWNPDLIDERYKFFIYYAYDNNEDIWKYYYYDTNQEQWNDVTNFNNISSGPSIENSISFNKYQYYIWDKENGYWENSDLSTVTFASFYVDGTEDSPYMVIISEFDDYRLPNLEVGDLYHWENGKWKKVATAESNNLNRTISQMLQTSNEISARVTDTEDNLASIDERVTDNETAISEISTYGDKLTVIEQKSNDNEAKISMLVANGVKRINVWNESEHTSDTDRAKIFYDGTYYYYYHNGWTSTTDPSNSYITAKIHSSGIITSINNDISNIRISGDKIDINGSNVSINASRINVGSIISTINNGTTYAKINADKIDLQGYVTISALKTSGSTTINGSNIATGTLKAESIRAGKIVQRNASGTQTGTSYLDLDNDKFVAGGTQGYRTEMSYSGIDQYASNNKIGTVAPTFGENNNDNSMMVAYNKANAQGINLCYENTSGAFTRIFTIKDNGGTPNITSSYGTLSFGSNLQWAGSTVITANNIGANLPSKVVTTDNISTHLSDNIVTLTQGGYVDHTIYKEYTSDPSFGSGNAISCSLPNTTSGEYKVHIGFGTDSTNYKRPRIEFKHGTSDGFLYMNTNGALYWNSNSIVTSGNIDDKLPSVIDREIYKQYRSDPSTTTLTTNAISCSLPDNNAYHYRVHIGFGTGDATANRKRPRIEFVHEDKVGYLFMNSSGQLQWGNNNLVITQNNISSYAITSSNISSYITSNLPPNVLTTSSSLLGSKISGSISNNNSITCTKITATNSLSAEFGPSNFGNNTGGHLFIRCNNGTNWYGASLSPSSANGDRGFQIIDDNYTGAVGIKLRPQLPSSNPPDTYLGSNSVRFTHGYFNNVYSDDGTIKKSDRKLKKDIKNIDDKYEDFFDSLNPVSYKFKDGGSGRTHLGFISQEVEDSLVSNNMTSMDFAGLCKNKILENGEDSNDMNFDGVDDSQINYRLRYDEFIALCVDKIQKLDRRVKELERKLENE